MSNGLNLGYPSIIFDAAAYNSLGGKSAAIEQIRLQQGDASIIAMIGDGITDLECKEVVEIFIGYGGNVERPVVRDGSDWFITDFSELFLE